MLTRMATCLALVLVTGTASAQALADRPPPQHRVVYRSLTVARVNPIGLIEDARIAYRARLFRSESLALRDNFVSIGLAPTLSPAFARIGVVAEVQPLSILQVWAMYEFISQFGTFDHLQSFPSARSEYSDQLIADRGELPDGHAERNYATTGTQLTVGATLQLRLGQIAVRTQAKALRPDYDLRDGDVTYYDIIYDVLAPNRGWVVTNDADVLYQVSRALIAGVRWTYTQPFYTAEHYLAGEPEEDPNGATHRLGPLVAYTFHSRDGAAFNSPTLLLVVNWWLKSRYRTGAETSQAIPYVALGFAFTGDLVPLGD